MGGKDVIHLKQLQKSNLQPTEVQKILKQVADQRFSEDLNESLVQNPDKSSGTQKVYNTLESQSLKCSLHKSVWTCVRCYNNEASK